MFFRSQVQNVVLTLALLLAGGLSGCAMPDGFPALDSTGEAASAYQTVSVILTQTAAAAGQTLVVLPTAETPQPSVTSQPLKDTIPAVVAETPSPTVRSTPPCEIAAAGNPFDVSIPDDSKMHPGESFVKTWRLVNAGSCSWSREYGIVHFSGVDMGSRREDFFLSGVNPGESLDISLDMVAPSEPGSYQGNYKLRGRSGQLFGIGPEGSSPFWVRIEVIALDTATPTLAPPTLTPTAVVFISGNAQLELDQAYDLDLAALGPGDGDDLILRRSGEMLEWVPANEARIVVHGATEPGSEACKSAVTSTEPLVLGIELEGSYLCVRTDRGLPAQVYLAHVDPAAPTLEIQFVVWSAP